MVRFSFQEDAIEKPIAGAGAGAGAVPSAPYESELIFCKKRKRESDDEVEEMGMDVRIDPDVLDCIICFDPLRPPIFQCQNGHVACSSCHSKLLNKCHLCSQRIGFSRCLALEKVIESMKVSCPYAIFGCNKATPFIDIENHKETCIFAPCICPVSDCKFSSSRELLSAHFMDVHVPDEQFKYDRIFNIRFLKTNPFRILYAEDGHLFLLLNNNIPNMGNALSIMCLRPCSVECDFIYELATDKCTSSCESSCLLLSSRTVNSREWKGIYPMKFYLLVPPEFCTHSGIMMLNIRISKVEKSAA